MDLQCLKAYKLKETNITNNFKRRQNYMNNAILILGNGFDLCHGYKTSYSDFIRWFQKQEDLQENIWVKHFSKQLNYSSWVDIEKEIKNITDQFTALRSEYPNLDFNRAIDIKYKPLFLFLGFKVSYHQQPLGIDAQGHVTETENFSKLNLGDNDRKTQDTLFPYQKQIEVMKSHFSILRSQLKDYILIETVRSLDRNELIQATLEKYDNILAINFNYTSTIRMYGTSNIVNIHVHGHCDDEIVLGHNDIIDEDFAMFKKSTQQSIVDANYKNKILQETQKLKNRNNFDLIILGHSFDENDFDVLKYGISKFTRINTIRNLKIFHYLNKSKNDTLLESEDLMKKIYNIQNFFKNKTDFPNYYSRLEEKGAIEKIEL